MTCNSQMLLLEIAWRTALMHFLETSNRFVNRVVISVLFGYLTFGLVWLVIRSNTVMLCVCHSVFVMVHTLRSLIFNTIGWWLLLGFASYLISSRLVADILRLKRILLFLIWLSCCLSFFLFTQLQAWVDCILSWIGPSTQHQLFSLTFLSIRLIYDVSVTSDTCS